MDLSSLLDDPFRVICHYLANQVFTFDSEHAGALRAGQMLNSTDLRLINARSRDRKALEREIRMDDSWDTVGAARAAIHQSVLLTSFRAATKALVLLASTSKTFMRRIPWRSIYFELAPLASARIIWWAPKLGIPTYHMIADDAFISPIYFYLSILRMIGGYRSRRSNTPNGYITTPIRDAMTREMQQLIVKARKDDAAARDPRRSARKRRITHAVAEDDEPARKRAKRL